ncbi:MAG: UDP-N-acetylglucosamine 2-epimerase (non-hydrolyzing) [Marinilabiliales bacterium]|nr:MAG: UDP-N-acetylglucosamine 2-epimerase (non-hydrolyzing) [Marinilabiliales bacterium]
MKIVTIIGARPQIIKAAAISRAISNHFSEEIEEHIVHTGQHYDDNMSDVFFSELGIPEPDINLNVGSGMHGKQTAAMTEGIEKVLVDIKPDYLVLYGDTNSTLAGAVAASKLLIPIVHIEAGLRSFNKTMPEEINRIVCDHCSALLFSPTPAGIRNLEKEGFPTKGKMPHNSDNPGVFHCGDVMYDNSLHFAGLAEEQSKILERLNLRNKRFVLATIHRNQNTDNAARLQFLFNALAATAVREKINIVLPLHPRTQKMLEQNNITIKEEAKNMLQIVPPVSFLDMIMLEKHSSLVMTDSGGVQKEAFYFEKPAIILRPETEWIEIVEHGTAALAAETESELINQASEYLNNPPTDFPEIFGDGKASVFICKTMLENHRSKN